MYVEKTTAEERGIIGSKVEGLIIQFDTPSCFVTACGL